MGLPVQEQVKYWGAATAVFVLILWFLGDVLLPFVLGGAIAYFLDPVADRLEKWGLSRVLATVIITAGAVLIFVIMSLLVIPTLIQQAVSLFETAPTLFTNLQVGLTERFPQLMDETSTLRQSLASIGQTIQAKGGDFLNSLFTSALSLLNIVLLFVLVPVVAFYLLLDWDRMVAQIDDYLPRDHAPAIRQLAKDIDATLASFIRGQGTVCLILGVYYAAALMLAGLNFGLVVGAVAGLISFIPYVGAIVGGALSIGLALFQFWGSVEVVTGDTVTYTTDWLRIAFVAAIFALGQVIEGNVLTPKLVGSSVGLHPVWLIFALSVFGALFGFIGLLVAVPVAASIGVFVRFALGQYKGGRLYRGLSETDRDR
jgi:predicted PurR-regulated permease PerM